MGSLANEKVLGRSLETRPAETGLVVVVPAAAVVAVGWVADAEEFAALLASVGSGW
jgi:hypothetical protein